MSTIIQTINGTDVIANSRTDINNNFSSLNTNKIETSVIDTDTSLTANSDSKIASQKAIKTYVDTGGNPSALSYIMPVGAVLPYSGASAPSLFLLCDGSAVNRTTYATLFGVIGTTYGTGNGSTTFNLPDLKGRVPVGKSTDTEFDVLGETGGEKTHVLTVGELASHNHTALDSSGAYLDTGGPTGSGGLVSSTVINGTGNSSNGATTAKFIGNTGSNTAHNNLQPYITLNYIIKY